MPKAREIDIDTIEERIAAAIKKGGKRDLQLEEDTLGTIKAAEAEGHVKKCESVPNGCCWLGMPRYIAKFLGRQKWLEGAVLDYLHRSAADAVCLFVWEYSEDVLKGRWEDAEEFMHALGEDDDWAQGYCKTHGIKYEQLDIEWCDDDDDED